MHVHVDVLAILVMHELVMHVDAVLVVAVIVVMMAADGRNRSRLLHYGGPSG